MYRFWRWVSDHWVMVVGLLVLAYLFLPIVVVFLLSINKSTNRLSYDLSPQWTLDYWLHPFGAALLHFAFTEGENPGLRGRLGLAVFPPVGGASIRALRLRLRVRVL